MHFFVDRAARSRRLFCGSWQPLRSAAAFRPFLRSTISLPFQIASARRFPFWSRRATKPKNFPRRSNTFLALDYPRYEVVAVDDRSIDATGTILARRRQSDSRLKDLRIDSLPPGWLGKPHALQHAYENATGEWLVFTDADVHFAPDLLAARACTRAANEDGSISRCSDSAKMFTVGEKIAMTFFSLGFLMGIRPWRVSDSRSRRLCGRGRVSTDSSAAPTKKLARIGGSPWKWWTI